MMYNWRFLSFFIFASMFWSVSMVSTSIAFLLFSSYLGHGDHEEDKPVKKEEPLEQSEGEQEPSNDMFSTAFSTLTHQRKMGTPVRTKSEEAGIIKEEVLEETTAIPPLRGQTLEGEADDEAEDVELVRAGGDYTDSGIGTSVESGSVRVVQRRRSRPFASRDDDN
jgi:seipin